MNLRSESCSLNDFWSFRGLCRLDEGLYLLAKEVSDARQNPNRIFGQGQLRLTAAGVLDNVFWFSKSDWAKNRVDRTCRMAFLRFSARIDYSKKFIADSHLFVCVCKSRVVKVKFFSLTDFLLPIRLLVRLLC